MRSRERERERDIETETEREGEGGREMINRTVVTWNSGQMEEREREWRLWLKVVVVKRGSGHTG